MDSLWPTGQSRWDQASGRSLIEKPQRPSQFELPRCSFVTSQNFCMQYTYSFSSTDSILLQAASLPFQPELHAQSFSDVSFYNLYLSRRSLTVKLYTCLLSMSFCTVNCSLMPHCSSLQCWVPGLQQASRTWQYGRQAAARGQSYLAISLESSVK